MRGSREPVEKPLNGVLGQEGVEVFPSLATEVQQSLPYGCRDVTDAFLRHARASSVGRMMLATRSTFAISKISAGVAFFFLRQSRRASIATSLPTVAR